VVVLAHLRSVLHAIHTLLMTPNTPASVLKLYSTSLDIAVLSHVTHVSKRHTYIHSYMCIHTCNLLNKVAAQAHGLE